MQRERAHCVVTSPPYVQQRTYNVGVPAWDELIQGAFRNLPVHPQAQLLVNLGPVHQGCRIVRYWWGWLEWMTDQGWNDFAEYIWDKGYGLPGNWAGRLAPAHEFIFHLNRMRRQANKIIPKQEASVIAQSRPVGLRNRDGSHEARPMNPNTCLGTHKISKFCYSASSWKNSVIRD